MQQKSIEELAQMGATVAADPKMKQLLESSPSSKGTDTALEDGYDRQVELG